MHAERLAAVSAAVRRVGARTVLDLGCGDGDLILRLAPDPGIERIVGVDTSPEALDRLRRRLAGLDPAERGKVSLVHASMTDLDRSHAGFDAAVLVEAIEHVAPERLSVVERALFRTLAPGTLVVTTPNSEFNPLLGVPPHRFRHPEHRFEWDRARFRAWASGVASRCGYRVTVEDIAGRHPDLGGASQMALFRRDGARIG